MAKTSGPTRLRELLAETGIICSLGAHDVLSAMIIEQAGFETVFMGGFGASASLLGLPDLGFLTMSEMAGAVGRTAARVSIPVIADADTRYGGLHNVIRTVEVFESAGAAGLLIEDQVSPKRCGHFDDKRVIDAEEMTLKVKAAVAARGNPDFVIIARTDARQMNGLDDAIDRVNRYCEAGADVAFVEAPTSTEELEQIASRVQHPLLANMVTGGATPIVSAHDLEQMGYRFAVYPVESLEVCARAMKDLCKELKTTGRADRIAAEAMSFAELKRILGVEKYLSLRDSMKI